MIVSLIPAPFISVPVITAVIDERLLVVVLVIVTCTASDVVLGSNVQFKPVVLSAKAEALAGSVTGITMLVPGDLVSAPSIV